MLRAVGSLATIVAFVAIGSASIIGAAETLPPNIQATDARHAVLAASPQPADRPGVFVTLPFINGFTDATDALVETQGLVRDALIALGKVRLVERPQNGDATLTVRGRGRGDAELTAAVNALDHSVIASPVMIRSNERYIEGMLTVGLCGDAATDGASQGPSGSCHRRIFVGLGFTDRDAGQNVKRAPPNSWKACADALARDVQAWVTQNASRLLIRPE